MHRLVRMCKIYLMKLWAFKGGRGVTNPVMRLQRQTPPVIPNTPLPVTGGKQNTSLNRALRTRLGHSLIHCLSVTLRWLLPRKKRLHLSSGGNANGPSRKQPLNHLINFTMDPIRKHRLCTTQSSNALLPTTTVGRASTPRCLT